MKSLNCKHEFCKGCIAEYLQAQIEDGKVGKIQCMEAGCKEVFQKEDVERCGTKEIFTKYLRFKENIVVDNNPNLKWCPKLNCNKYVERAGGWRNNIGTCECG